ncbi:MAG: hypothetical protein IPO09_05905 [Anaeromyxobacter sp.]|nr:hypothetical protein [Anaeromyxobacter sp.]MBL0277204.1 hypothetical protein [Anaeromyxobacter sp.]
MRHLALHAAWGFAVLAAPATAAALPPQSPATVQGTYRVRAVATLAGVPLVRELELRADVLLAPGSGGREVRARLASRGQACALTALVAADGTLGFTAGERCTIALDEPGTRGAVVATVRTGRGRVADRRLVLELRLGLEGAVHLATGQIPGLGGETDLPVSGEAVVRAEGRRDDSRAAGRRGGGAARQRSVAAPGPSARSSLCLPPGPHPDAWPPAPGARWAHGGRR